MEFFNKAKAVRLKSRHDKYLIADEDEETVRQSHNGSSERARWTVEFIPGDSHHIRLKSCYGKYLTASDEPHLLGMVGKKVVQDMPISRQDRRIVWEPRTERYHVKLRTREGKFLRANDGMPPWRNSITHDIPHRTSTQDWVLWEVDVVDILEDDSLPDYASFSSFSSSLSSSADSKSSDASDHSAHSSTTTLSHHRCAFSREVATKDEVEGIANMWQPPDEGWVKVNTHGAVTKFAARAAAGGVVRGSRGQWLRGFMHRLSPCSVAMAEIWGVYGGLSVAWELKVPKVVVEIDNLEVAEVLLGQADGRLEEIPLLECIGDLVGREWTVHFVHTYKECNLVAGWLAKEALLKDDGQMILESPPDGCLRLFCEDAVLVPAATVGG